MSRAQVADADVPSPRNGRGHARRAVTPLAWVGAALVVVGTVIPVNGGGGAGYPYAILDLSVQRELVLFALEPLAVAVMVLAATVVRTRQAAVAAGLLLAFGAQLGTLFLAHLGIAALGDPEFNSLRLGSFVGVAGAMAILAAGVGAYRSRASL